MTELLIASIAFAGTHFLLSHPLRTPLIGRIGEGPFLGLYSLVAFVTLGWTGYAFYRAPATEPLWAGTTDLFWAIATVIMLIASMLFAGSLAQNPAAPSPGKMPDFSRPATGVFAITRHPMMWSFALWGIAHILVTPRMADIILAGAIIVVALGGSWGQDIKKRRLYGEAWTVWEKRTSYIPFARQLAGGANWAATVPTLRVTLIGIVLWLVATLLHGGLGAGIWRWIG